jgi:glutaredoxin
MKLNYFFILTIILFSGCLGQPAAAAPMKTIDIYMFEGQGCPHCAKMKQEIESLKASEFPQINLTEFEVNYNADNQKTFIEYSKVYGFPIKGVPVILIGNQYITGENVPELNRLLDNCLINECPSPKTLYDAYYQTNDKPQFNTASESNYTTDYATIGWGALILAAIVGLIVLFVKMEK